MEHRTGLWLKCLHAVAAILNTVSHSTAVLYPCDSPVGSVRAEHLSDLAARHPDIEELVVQCHPCGWPEDRTFKQICQVPAAILRPVEGSLHSDLKFQAQAGCPAWQALLCRGRCPIQHCCCCCVAILAALRALRSDAFFLLVLAEMNQMRPANLSNKQLEPSCLETGRRWLAAPLLAREAGPRWGRPCVPGGATAGLQVSGLGLILGLG